MPGEAVEGPRLVQRQAGPNTSSVTTTENNVVLRLRLPLQSAEGAHDSNPNLQEEDEKRVTWDEDVVNNEHMNRKKSNKCCIYHKPKAFDESDSESGGDSDHEEDEFRKRHPQFAGRKPVSDPNKPKRRHGHCHGHCHGGHDSHKEEQEGDGDHNNNGSGENPSEHGE
mmetsp:Transcript_7358/g.14645  ORF Transcript_7358/g.14645 Transcript_7358/m.14645 type:complete len:168 (+) Transcript_7358:181-684(+)|eukprot:CAMPEP_0171493386 /NCGR_PEP_ID=MMETSP0958-20121227/4934_1 /TAXON_ID=87120 /ORGANISM="Aurantiochytrium limacinum, Strain ATCCMYA-1381" /LENGTH=167 /DNA_ID=CAMNT_0012027005 /DNA_START=111 /DNA_END=614 /DNA_ORIENTATION=+